MANDDRPDPPDHWRVYGQSGAAPTPEPEPGSDSAAPATWVPDNTPPAPTRPDRPTATGSKVAVLVIALALLTVVVGVGALVLLLSGGGGIGGTNDATSQEGFDDLVADLEDEVGHTRVFEAVIYPEYAIVDSVVAEGDDKYDSYSWDGDIEEWSNGTSTDQPFDLAEIDAAVLDGLCEPVLDMVEETENGCYLIIRHPWVDGSATWISAYASNKYGESGYIEYDLEGNELARHEP
jgi:hypothetical protein